MSEVLSYTVAADRSSTTILDAAGKRFRSHFQFVPHYDLVHSPRYVCFVPLLRPGLCVGKVKAPISTNHHIFSLIHDHILKAAAEGRCLLIFDASPEGDPLIERAYQDLHSWLTLHNIPDKSVLIVSLNRNLGREYKLRIGGDIKFGYYDYFIKELLNAFDLDDFEFENIMGFAAEAIRFDDHAKATKTFLYLNATPRPHRIAVAAGLLAKGILSDAEWSMLGTVSSKLEPSALAAKQIKNELGLHWISDDHIDSIISQMPKLIVEEEHAVTSIRNSNQLALRINPQLYNFGLASIVTETEFSDGAVKRISEATLKPIMMGHPTILFANPFSLGLLRDFGFSTFDGFIDESYDTITNPGLRFEAATKSILSFQELCQRVDELILSKMKAVCARNVSFGRHQASKAYENNIERCLLHNILTAAAPAP